ncbi:MAG TPA: amino acid adenylation domain-containing protein [Opitutaceae bacterium]
MSASKETLLRQLLASKGLRPSAAAPDAGPSPRPAGEPAALSFAQERLWFVQQLQPENTAYLLGQAFVLRGALDPAALAAAWTDVVRRHEVLRTGLPERAGRASLVVLPAEAVALDTEDLSGLAAAEQTAVVAARTRDVLATPFDLARPPLVRIRLLRLGSDEHRLLFCVHHLVFDGWSIGLLLADLAAAYTARRAGAAPAWTPLALHYADYAAWQRRRATTPAWADALHAWEQRLAGVPVLALPVDHRRPEVLSGRGAGHRFTLPPALVTRLRALGAGEQATLFMTLLAAWQAVLARYSGQTDFAVGSPVANRNHPALEGIVGFFVNMIVLRADLAGDPDFRTLLRRTAVEVQAALARQEIPFDQIVERLKVPRDPAHHPLFQAGFTFQNAPTVAAGLAGVELRPLEPEVTASKFDLLLALEETPDGALGGLIEYSTDLFLPGTIRRLAANLETLLTSAVAAPDVACSQLALVSPAERAEPVPRVARVAEPAGRETLAEWFRAVARREASRVAVTDGTTTLTYAELDAKSDRLASFLRAQGVGPDRLVAIALERSTQLIVAMLGVVKAGGGYLPVDPAYPQDRQAFMIEDGAAVLVLTESSLAGRIAQVPGIPQVEIDTGWDAIAATPPPKAGPALAPGHTAYVIYTSGSTGKPKGVPVTQRNVCRLFTQTEPWFGFGPEDVWTMFHSFAFDFSVWEIWGALLYGGRLVVVPYAVSRATDQFYAWLARERVTVLNQTPSAFRQLSQHEEGLAAPPPLALRCVVFGGEALDFGLLAPWIARHGDRAPRLINMYGITETTVHVTYREISAADVRMGKGSVIGVPIPDLELHLVDAHLQPVPRGVAGEILVGGEGLARGYLNRPELTAERFIAHPLASGSGGRLYRSGDLARRLDNGDIEYLGRIDFQVKIRGFRIELGEIESALGRHPEIAAACVLAERGTGGDARLLAWLVGRSGAVVTVEALRSHLQAFLPDYMVPAVFTWVERLPLTTNGKVDRAALRSLEGRRAEAGAEHVAPAGPAETLLAGVWAEVLGVPAVGVTDNFFALGGDSIRSIEVRSKVRARGWDFPLQDLFRHQTVRELAAVLVPAVAADARPGAFALVSAEDRARLPSGVADAYPLTALQAGMVFHSELHPETPVFHDLFSYHLRVAWDEGALRAVLADIVRRHPILRTSVHKGGFAEPLQCVHASIALPLTVQDLTALDPQAQEAAVATWWDDEKARGFDWTQPGLFRICVHRRTAATLQFSLSLHHAIMDGWSVAAFLTEIFSRYLARLAGGAQAAQTDGPAPAFRDFVGLERAALASETTRQFWRNYLDDPQVIRLPRRPDRAPVDTTMARQDAVFLTWRDDRYDALKALAARAGVSLKHVLLAAHARVVGFLGNQPDVITGVISNGRPEASDAAQGLGLFLNTAPFRIRAETGTWLDLIQAALRADEAVHPHRRYPLAELQKTWGRQSLFETAFNFVHFHVFDALRDRPDLAVLDSRFFDQNTFAYFAQFSADGPARSLQLELRYDPAEFTREQVTEFVACYERALAAMTAAPEARVHAVGLLSPEAWAELRGFHANRPEHDRTLRLHDRFERRVQASPHAIALVDGTRRLTYAELDARANAWAAQLQAQGAGPERLVGVCLERSADLVTALLAVLKTGAAYVPLDPLYPADRLGYMCADARVGLLVSRPPLAAKLPSGDWALVDVAQLAAQPPRVRPPVCAARPENLAYLIYTSGSTGRPKATAIEHRSAVALIAWAEAVYPPEELAGVLAATSVCFDLSIYELFVTLALGGKVILAENALALPELPARGEVTLVNTVPSAMNELIRSGALPANVRVVNLAGEPLPAALADKIYATGTVEKVYDLYGPSEDTTYSTWALRSRGGPETIGRPLANTQLYLLDAALQPVPLGAVGELFLGGEGLARGYLGRPDLTAERFIPDPFAATPGGRLYRTGDLGRFRPDGQVEFLGRSDHQIKIRGFRIELGEIEAVLRSHPQVSEAAVIAREDEPGRKQLAAYVVGATLPTGRALDAELRSWLGSRLPEYFVPAAFVALPALPQTPNGKLDRKALPAPATVATAGDAGAGGGDDFVAPVTAAEQTLAQIWIDVLKIPRVGRHDNYFALGGDSILVLQVVSRARAAGLALSPRLVFERPTLAELADAVGTTLPVAAGESEPAGPWPLLPIQHWFFAQAFAEPDHWNQSVLLSTREPLEPRALQAALEAVVAHHPALRLRFAPAADGAWTAQPDSAARPAFRVASVADAAGLTAACAAEQAALRIERAELVRAVLFTSDDPAAGRLFIVIHHLAIDGVSWRVLLEDLQTAYRALRTGSAPALPPVTASAAAWARWQQGWGAGATATAEASHWLTLAGEALAIRALPRDHAEGSNCVAEVGIVAVTLEPAETETLLRRVLAGYGAQINDVLLAALGRVLQAWTGRDRTLIHLEGHGRESATAGLDLSRSVGWFTSLFPVALDVAGLADPVARVAAVRRTLAAVPQRGVGYGAGRWLASPARWEVPAAEVCFNYLGQVDASVGEGSAFGPAPEPVGPHYSPRSARAHLIDVNAIVVGGRLRCEWHHATRIHDEATVRRHAEAFVAELRTLIAAAPAPGTANRYDLAGASDADVAAAIDEIEF